MRINQADIIGAEALKRLEGKNIQSLSLEEALEIKELVDVGARGRAYSPEMLTALNGPTSTRRIYATLSSHLNRHIDLLYGKEAAPDQVEALEAAYKHKNKLYQDMEELKSLLETTGSDIVRAKGAPFSFGEDKEARYSSIRRSEQAFDDMRKDIEQKSKEISLVEAEISRLASDIERLKGAYLAEHPRPVRAFNAAYGGPAVKKSGRAKMTNWMKAEAIRRRHEQKAVHLTFTINTHEGEDYFVNDRGDMLRMDGTWVGRFDGRKIVAMPEPANIADAKMRALRPMTGPPPYAAAIEDLIRAGVLPAEIVDELRGAGASDEYILKAVEELGLPQPMRKGGRRTRRNSRKRKSYRKKRG